MSSKRASESWRVREVASVCALRIIDAIERSSGEAAEGGEGTSEGDVPSDAMKEEHLKRRAAHEEKLELLRSEVARLRAQHKGGGAPNAALSEKEDVLRNHDVGGADYVAPKLLSGGAMWNQTGDALARPALARLSCRFESPWFDA